jgi:hypothetical protein
MANGHCGCIHVGRRDFIRTTALAGMATALPEAMAQTAAGVRRRTYAGNKRKLLLLSDAPESYERLIQAVKAVREFEFSVVTARADYQKPQEVTRIIRAEDPDILFFGLPRTMLNAGNLPVALDPIDVPMILLPPVPELIMMEANAAAGFRVKGANALLANSEAHAIELMKILAAPRLLEGKRAVIYGRPFDSSSVPSRDLTAEMIYNRTGVRLEHRPVEQLADLLGGVVGASRAALAARRGPARLPAGRRERGGRQGGDGAVEEGGGRRSRAPGRCAAGCLQDVRAPALDRGKGGPGGTLDRLPELLLRRQAEGSGPLPGLHPVA